MKNALGSVLLAALLGACASMVWHVVTQ